MSFINHAAKELNCKIIYYGPGLGGKTTNLQHIYNETRSEDKSALTSQTGETERTLFFDFLPINIGEIKGFKTRFHLYSVPGQRYYDASRRMVLRGVDGIVFVADSNLDRMEDNIESLKTLDLNLREQGYDLRKLPFVFQYNKRDAMNPVPLPILRKHLNTFDAEEFEAVASQGSGVFDTLKGISLKVLHAMRN